MEDLIKQIQSIIDVNLPLYTNLANASAILNKLDNINWCGFYIADGETLYLGPFQGDVACTTIPFGKGVCGTSALTQKTIIVDNVNEFKGHIACSSISKSEIVVPIIINGVTKAVIDIDAPIYSRFSSKEQLALEKISSILKTLF